MESATDLQPAWQRFGLAFQPFSGAHRALAYCQVPSVQRLIQWMEGQVAPWLMIEGPKGSGKSAFISDWMRRHRGRCIRLQGSEGASVHNIQKKLRLQGHVQSKAFLLTEDLAHIRYIFIDDAHRLPQATSAWLQQQKWPASLQFVLATEVQLDWGALCEVSRFTLQPWSLDDIGFYCMKRLRQAGWQSDLPELKRSVLHVLLRETNGWVAQLDQAIEAHWPWQHTQPGQTSLSRLQIKALNYRMPHHFLQTPRGVSIALLTLLSLAGIMHILLPSRTDAGVWQRIVDQSDWLVGQLLHCI